MYAQLFTQSPLLVLPLVALALFAGVFSSVSFRVFARKASTYDAAAALPLESDAHDPHSASEAPHV